MKIMWRALVYMQNTHICIGCSGDKVAEFAGREAALSKKSINVTNINACQTLLQIPNA